MRLIRFSANFDSSNDNNLQLTPPVPCVALTLIFNILIAVTFSKTSWELRYVYIFFILILGL
jgi:hypothetical protein